MRNLRWADHVNGEKAMAETILLTGGTGFLGTELAAMLCRIPDQKSYVLVRSESVQEAYHRLRGAWHHDRILYESIGDTVLPVCGDFSLRGLGLSREDSRAIRNSVTLVIHAGAETGFASSRRELAMTNYTGTRNMLSFAGSIRGLTRFVYISTAYVAGQRKGLVMEEDPPAAEFSSFYERSKAKAEELVRASGLPFSICRPGMIVGDSGTGWIRNFNTVYYVLKRMLLGKMPVFPISSDTLLNIVPGDYVADSILRICSAKEAEGRTFHLTCPAEKCPRAGELAEFVRAWAKKNLSVNIPEPVFAPMSVLRKAGLIHNSLKTGSRKKTNIGNLMMLMPYFFSEQIFDRTQTDRICGAYDMDWHKYASGLLDFACRRNFMRQSGQTVFEQACVRRASRRYPISYHDVSSDGIHTVSGPEANEKIQRIYNALWAWGIRKGDRLALTGINSVDYMTLEQAIGLLGAVSVPVYYTTPAAEVSVLLEKSGAKWFFIGDGRMMRQLEDIETVAKIVSFSAGQETEHPAAMRWEEFMSKSGTPAPRQYPDPDDLATIRYTSGTTGEPKGVMFRYGQLAWMGEVLTTLLTWRESNDKMRYLSFLPLSHVVEGILALYAPYYVLCRVDYYFLNDFSMLTDALPKVRPTVFFSVPRFYEKVWDQVTLSRTGQVWLSMEDSLRRKVLAAVLRKAVLRKAGIDCCKQLIVGSAPVSESLLNSFRSLGIEIYNAYEQTEAPLITINRPGDNIIPTIGTPLPETTVTAEPDGELIVTGPQVTPGYFGLQTENIHDGVLRTGDLGVIHENGHITLYGRKKDFIVTAYGKNISIAKVEERIKDIPGVQEAVLIGEGRPFCTALIWVEDGLSEAEIQLAGRIDEMNANLSHPEQVRRYRVIRRPLSIQAGELTPNLKVKRKNVEANLADEIEEMYR